MRVPTSVEDLKASIKIGDPVFWSNPNYICTFSSVTNEFYVKCKENGHTVGLFNKAGEITHDLADFRICRNFIREAEEDLQRRIEAGLVKPRSV